MTKLIIFAEARRRTTPSTGELSESKMRRSIEEENNWRDANLVQQSSRLGCCCPVNIEVGVESSYRQGTLDIKLVLRLCRLIAVDILNLFDSDVYKEWNWGY